MEEQHRYRGGLVWPVILIGAGVVFLLSNLGVLGWDVWTTLWRLWPVLLIAIGLDIMIGRRSILGSLVIALLLLAVLGAAIWGGVPRWNLDGAVERTETVSAPLEGAERADVEIAFGTGTLEVGSLPEGSPDLARGSAELSRRETLQQSRSTSAGIARLVLRSQFANGVGLNWVGEGKLWDLELNQDVPTRLEVSTGVGRATLDLTRMNLTRLAIDGGVGQATIKLPLRGRFEVDISGGVGEITLIVPESLAVRVRTNGGLGGVSVEGDFRRSDREWVSPNFNSAENRAQVSIDGGVGRIVIREASE
jgi:hypothetical protein